MPRNGERETPSGQRKRGCSAVGSAPHWQCGGHGFESRQLHAVWMAWRPWSGGKSSSTGASSRSGVRGVAGGLPSRGSACWLLSVMRRVRVAAGRCSGSSGGGAGAVGAARRLLEGRSCGLRLLRRAGRRRGDGVFGFDRWCVAHPRSSGEPGRAGCLASTDGFRARRVTGTVSLVSAEARESVSEWRWWRPGTLCNEFLEVFWLLLLTRTDQRGLTLCMWGTMSSRVL